MKNHWKAIEKKTVRLGEDSYTKGLRIPTLNTEVLPGVLTLFASKVK